MNINLKPWTQTYLQTVSALFGARLQFVGLQGSYGRDEATATSDIDLVLILDTLTTNDLSAYREAISALPYRDKICVFVAGREELLCWSRADLFQFYHDTTPLSGKLSSLIPEPGKNEVREAILIGACNIYHQCGHNFLHEKNPYILKALYKSAVFVVQALHHYRTGLYVKKHCDLLAAVEPRERRLLATHFQLKQTEPGQTLNFDAASEQLFAWSGQVIREHGIDKR